MSPTLGGTALQLAFGPKAERWLSEHRCGGPIVCADLDGAVEAVVAAFRLRLQGQRFLTAAVLEDPESFTVAQAATHMMRTEPDLAKRTQVLETLAARQAVFSGVAQRDVCTFPRAQLQTLGTFARLGDALAFDSAAMQQRLRTLFRQYRPRFERVAFDWACDVPRSLPAREPRHLVLWAPALPVDRLLLHVIALESTAFPIVVVCAQEGKLPGSRAVFVTPASAGGALCGAIAVVDATTESPAAACALAELGLPVAAASPSGAGEFLNVPLYDPWDRHSIAAAVESARGLPAGPPLRVAGTDPAPLQSGTALVSVVVPTYRRPLLLPVALASIQRQTHPNVETIVVNDGAESVAALVAPFARTRLIELPENRGLPAARNAGARAAAGRFLAFLDDDDVIFPDHLAALSGALERADAKLAHADTLACYLEPDGDAYNVLGFEAGFVGPFDRERFLVTNSIPVHAWMVDREAFLAAGAFDETFSALEDWEFFLRLTRTVAPLHVDRLSAVYMQRQDASSMLHSSSGKELALHHVIYERNPAGGIAAVEERRRQRLLEVGETQRPIVQPAARIANLRWPPPPAGPGEPFAL